MYIAHNIVRMHDTDMAGILYFARQFRFAHDAFEDMMIQEGVSFSELFTKSKFAFVIVHAEADYKASLMVGDKLEVHVNVSKIGTTSFTIGYKIYRVAPSAHNHLVGTAQTVHVALDRATRTKIHIPEEVKTLLHKYHDT